jgi:defect in organelle trafficking protein DotC
MNSSHKLHKAALCIAIWASVSTSPTLAQTQLDGVLGISSTITVDKDKVGYAREQILKEAATALGARVGLSERSKELLAILETRASSLDAKYNFNPLVIGANVLPPVISATKDVVALDPGSMRVAGAVYHIDEPARFAMPTPTWRDWLYVGLDESVVVVPTLGVSGPDGDAEKKLWQRFVKDSYTQGRAQAQAVFDANLAMLERTHNGMRRYYELWQRGMVSAPIIATASDIVVQEDENTIAVGNTLYRITAPTDFRPHQKWIPLE